MKVKQYINVIIIVAIIILSGLLIGNPLYKNNGYILYAISGVYSICYYIYVIIKKEKITINKLDIGICIITLSSLIPLLCKSYISLNGTVELIVQYLCILNLYIITKNTCQKNPKNITIIINTIIFSILILCIIGIDEMHSNYLEGLKKIIKYKSIESEERRLTSLFSYSNTMGAVCIVGVFLSLRQIHKSTSINSKIIYGITISIMLITMLLTYSRLVYLMFAVIALIYLIILAKKHNIQRKIRKKHILIISIISILCMLYLVIGIQISSKLHINDKYQKILYKVNGKKQYTFTFDITSTATDDKEEPFSINIIEKNKYFDDIYKTQIKFGTYIGKKEIKIQTQETTEIMYINIENANNESSFIINYATLNEKELILKYKMLPTGIIHRLSGIRLKNKSVWERFTFIKDGWKKAKKHWLFGLGGQAWEDIQNEVQSYNYYTKEMHSYPLKLLLENGILGLLGYIAVAIYIIKKIIQECKKDKIDMSEISLILAIAFISLHSMLDFDMSFFYCILIVNIMIAIISSKEKRIMAKNNNAIAIILIINSFITIYISAMEMYYKKDTEMLVINSVRTEEKMYETYYKLLPYNKKVKNNYYNILLNNKEKNEQKISIILEDIIKNEKYNTNNVNLSNINFYVNNIVSDKEYCLDKLESILNYINNTRTFFKYVPSMQINRLYNLKSIVNGLKEKEMTEYAEKFEEQFYKELEEREQQILDYEKIRYTKEEMMVYKKRIEELQNR